jgi:hypothetical protein
VPESKRNAAGIGVEEEHRGLRIGRGAGVVAVCLEWRARGVGGRRGKTRLCEEDEAARDTR